MSLKLYEVWMSGYLCSGMEGIPQPSTKIGQVIAFSFQDACDTLCSEGENAMYYDREHLTVWGCKLFDNEASAREIYG